MSRRALVVTGLLTLFDASGATADADLDLCDQRLRDAPSDREAARCFYDVASRTGEWTAAARRVTDHLATDPDNPWLHFYLGHVEWADRQPRVADRYRVAARLLAAAGDGVGETQAHLNVASFLRSIDDMAGAGDALDAALRASRSTTDGPLRHRVQLEVARHRLFVGDDLGHVERLLHEVEAAVFPDGAYDIRRDCLLALGQVAYELGHFRKASTYRQRSLEVAIEAGDLVGEAAARFEIAAVASMVELPDPRRRALVEELTVAALDAARMANHRLLEARSHGMLGDLLPGPAGRRHAEACLEIAEALDLSDVASDCTAGLARHLASSDPDRARQLVDRAMAASLDIETSWDLLYRLGALGRALPLTHSRDEAITVSRRILDTLDAIATAQVFESERLHLISVWSDLYYRAAGLLLDDRAPEPAQDSTRDDIATAFALIERLRLHAWRDAGRGELPRDGPTATALHAVLLDKVGLYRALLDPRHGDDERRRAHEALARAEADERRLRFELVSGRPDHRETLEPAALGDVEAALDQDEALLAFQVAVREDLFGAFGGGSWLVVVTHDGTRRYRLPDRLELEPTIQMLLGLDDPERSEGALVRLEVDLLGTALGDLPAGVERLILVPDGILHLLPFAALRGRPGGPPLADRYELVVAPSATHVARWRRLPRPTAERPVVVFADPTLESASERRSGPVERSWTLGAAPRLPRLPHARREGRSAIRQAPGSGVLLIGDAATESHLRSLDLGDFAIVHFAAHALVDTDRPQRSAIVLAAGGAEHDGLLHPAEIRELDLDGRVVVLSACSTAVGDVLDGVGVMNLARAFFQAGARAVVASLWPLPDDRAAVAFDQVYRHLAAGASLGAAVHAVQRQQIRSAEPAVGWAGLVVIGQGDLVPFPAATSAASRPVAAGSTVSWWLAVVLLATVGAGLALRRQRRLARARRHVGR